MGLCLENAELKPSPNPLTLPRRCVCFLVPSAEARPWTGEALGLKNSVGLVEEGMALGSRLAASCADAPLFPLGVEIVEISVASPAQNHAAGFALKR